LSPSDLGIDVSPVSPGERFTEAHLWEERNPERDLSMHTPMTEHRAFSTALRRFRLTCEAGEWEIETRRADKVAASASATGNTVTEIRDIVAYLPNRQKSRITTIGRLVYQGKESGRGEVSVTPTSGMRDGMLVETMNAALARVLEQSHTGISRTGMYDNDMVTRIIRDVTKRLGGAQLALARYFVPNTASGNGLTYAERFLAFAEAVEEVFGFTMLTVPMPPSFDSARSMSVALVGQYDLEMRRLHDEVNTYVEAFHNGTRKRVEREWEARVQAELRALREDLQRTVSAVGQLAQSTNDTEDEFARTAWEEMLGWLQEEATDMTEQFRGTEEKLKKCAKARGGGKISPEVAAQLEVAAQDANVRKQLDEMGLGALLSLLEDR
jgi:hypothetical protein